MRKCIYCLELNENMKGRPHAYPECLGQNNLTFDSGVICDKCDNYFSGLENVLVAHPSISSFIQKYGLPGKKGKIRKKLSYWKREGSNFSFEFNLNRDLDSYTVISDSFRIDQVKEVYSLGFTLNPPSQFDNSKFSRALHYIAFNLLAYTASSDYVLESRFNPARKYIRSPRRNEFWPFYTLEVKNIQTEDIHAKRKQAPKGTTTLQLFDTFVFSKFIK